MLDIPYLVFITKCDRFIRTFLIILFNIRINVDIYTGWKAKVKGEVIGCFCCPMEVIRYCGIVTVIIGIGICFYNYNRICTRIIADIEFVNAVTSACIIHSYGFFVGNAETRSNSYVRIIICNCL